MEGNEEWMEVVGEGMGKNGGMKGGYVLEGSGLRKEGGRNVYCRVPE